MLNKIVVENFKSHSNTEVSLNKLTLLVGTNSGGKSSVIQGILLLIHNVSSENISPLNGHLVSVGALSEVCNYINNSNSFSIEICDYDGAVKMEFNGSDEQDCEVTKVKNSDKLDWFLNYSNNKIHYLSAHRIGGQDLYDKNFDRYDTFGLNGEYTMDYFQHHKRDIIDDELIKNQDSLTLETQVDYWLDKIFGHRLMTSPILGTDKVKTEYRIQIGKGIRPKNMGSGISYLVSIIVICLASKKGDVIIIENPEIHLHPRAQAYLTEFLVFIANSGRQLIVETHSDHLFNGVRVAINQKDLSIEDSAIHFFSLDDDYTTKHSEIKLNERGRIANSIPNLFDQFDNDLDKLLGL